ncbi:MAG: hypothetical protein K0R26_1947 [Bacteroidota bacterium]|jgi:DNA-binding XRE family transcriptional regulator|nr:hypothetical protein [Bacteroidota bacterium]
MFGISNKYLYICVMQESDKRQFYELVGKKIKRERSINGINQAALGDKIGISRVSIVNIEKGKQMPPVHVIWKIASVLNVPMENLFPLPGASFSTSELEKNVKLNGSDVVPDSLKSIFSQLEPKSHE